MGSNPLPVPARRIGVPVYVSLAVVLVGLGAWFYLGRGSGVVEEDALTPEGKAYAANLRLSEVGMKATDSFAGQTIVEIEGKVGNAGDRVLDTVEIYCVFYDAYDQMVRRKRLSIVSSKMGGLKPGETKSFRLPFDDLPASWNQAIPHLVIASVRFA